MEESRTAAFRQQLESLYSISIEIARLHEMPQVLDRAMGYCLELTQSAFGFIGLLNEQNDQMDVAAIKGFEPSDPSFYEKFRLIPVRPSVFGLVIIDGRVVGETAAADPNVALARTGRAFTSVGAGGANIFVPVVIPGSGTAVVEVAVPDSRLHRGVATAWAILAATGLGLVLLAVVVADRIARGIVLPTRALAVAARRVSQGELQANVVPAGPAEITEVGRAFNLLVTRIGELLAAEREAAADLSHRLRTPLTALRINVDRLPSGSEADHLAADVDAIEQAVTDVIQELRRQSHEGISRVTDIVPAVRGRVTFWTSLANDEGRPWAVDVAPGSWKVALPRDEVETVVDVLLSNVFAHTPEKVPFRIVLDGAGGDQVRLMVEDDGPGFPPSMVARGQSGGGSTGLGLDIVRRAAASTGGLLSISEGENGGARVEVFFGLPDAGSPLHGASALSAVER